MDLNAIMQQAREMQQKMAKIQQDLATRRVTGSAGGGMVNVTATGKGDIISISIEEDLIAPTEKEMLQDLIVAATNDAIRQAQELGKQEMAGLAGGMQIPGLSGMF